MALQWVDLDGLDSVMTYIWERLALKADKSDLTTAVRFMGSVPTFAELPSTGNRVGDMWNVEEDGSNYCWKDGGGWDDLSGIIDLSNYYTIAESEAAFVGLSNEQTITATKTFIKQEAFRVVNAQPFITMQATNIAVGAMGSNTISPRIVFRDRDEVQMGYMGFCHDGNFSSRVQLTASNLVGNDSVSASISVWCNQDGTSFALAPTPPNASDNSTKIATTAWVNTSTSVVHTFGTELIDGQKTFLAPRLIFKNADPVMYIDCTSLNISEASPGTTTKNAVVFRDSDEKWAGYMQLIGSADGRMTLALNASHDRIGESKNSQINIICLPDGVAYATAPATRSTGYGSTDIVTAGWVDSKVAAITATAVTQAQIDAIVARLDALEAAT